jgi:hypothetical protein
MLPVKHRGDNYRRLRSAPCDVNDSDNETTGHPFTRKVARLSIG